MDWTGFFDFSWILRCAQNDGVEWLGFFVQDNKERRDSSAFAFPQDDVGEQEKETSLQNDDGRLVPYSYLQPFFVRFFEHFTYCTSSALSFRCSADRSMPMKFAVCETFPENRLI